MKGYNGDPLYPGVAYPVVEAVRRGTPADREPEENSITIKRQQAASCPSR